MDTMPPLRNTFAYWGKARPSAGSGAQFHLLPYHCLDVAAVGVEVLRRLPALRVLIGGRLGLKGDALDGWMAFWLALHDLGKFAESFQGQRADLCRLLLDRASPKPYTLRHDSVGMLFWAGELSGVVVEEGWFGPDSEAFLHGLHWWARAVTGHHGQPPKEGDDWAQHFDRTADRAAAIAFAREARRRFLDDEVVQGIIALRPKPFLRASVELSWWVAGLAVLADWLGSNTDHFSYRDDAGAASSETLDDYWRRAQRQAADALHTSGVLPPASTTELAFGELFPSIDKPSPLQAWAATVALPDAPQIHLLEDVTGAGKTEAAVMLAHRLMACAVADGFFIGLPTMATANAMYGRIAGVYARLFAGQASLVLANGQRDLVEEFAASVLPPGPVEGDPRQLDETATARCTAWLADHNKRALLAPAGVGTLDQALLAALQSRHQSLRLLGLLRKVLVVDEVHACDAYMQQVLAVLLEAHARAGGSAILLSATLPKGMKGALLDAFAKGLRTPVPAATATAYPLATSWPMAALPALRETAVATRSEVCRTVKLHYVDREDEVVAAIRRALAAGQCVCWIRNTVADVLAAHALFSAEVDPDRLMLFHARFALHDRLDREGEVLRHFGKEGDAEARDGRLLIASQVVEQSLDVDFDLVVTDLAPIDRLIQRAGRLRRHVRDEQGNRLREAGATDRRGTPYLWVFGPPWQDEPDAGWFKRTFPRAARVYPDHGRLWLTARAVRAGVMAMPDDARRLIEGVFGDAADIAPGLQCSTDIAEGEALADESQARAATIKPDTGYCRKGSDWWDDARAPSRLGEATVSVLLARWSEGELRPWVDGPHGWAYSGLRLRERQVEREGDFADPAVQDAFERLLPTLPAQGRWCVLMPLQRTTAGWQSVPRRAASAARDRRAEEPWCYDSVRGLFRHDPSVAPVTAAAVPQLQGDRCAHDTNRSESLPTVSREEVLARQPLP